jgi:hypothetical protein
MPTMWTQSKARSSEIATQAPKPDRCYLMDDIGHILALTVMNSGTEASAMREAATRFRGDPECRVIEVWEIEQRIARLRRAPVAALPATACA